METELAPNHKATVLMIVLAATLAFAVTMISAAESLKINFAPLPVIRLVGSCLGLMFSVIGATLHLNQHFDDDEGVIGEIFPLFLTTIVTTIVDLTHLITGYNPLIAFYLQSLSAASGIFFSLKIGIRAIRIARSKVMMVAAVPAATILVLVGLKAFYGGFLPLNTMENIIGMLHLLPTACLPLIVIGIMVLNPYLRRDPNSIWGSIKLVLLPKSSLKRQGALFYGLTFANLGLVIAYFKLLNADQHASIPLNTLSISWLPCATYTFFNLRHDVFIAKTHQALIALTSTKAIRFFLRHKQNNKAHWAATVGLRTACFIIDHDPHDDAGRRLTATLSHIRRDEIGRFARKILGNRNLSTKLLGSQILGTIDPEESTRPCVDVLTLFACIYLDVVPIVERRLKGLASLFPIIDPDLSGKIGPHNIEESHSKMEWLYHLDFQWVDQQLVLSDHSVSYGVTVDSMNTVERNTILTKLQEKNRTGNFIWIGEKARERLQMEAPYLANIIEPWSIDGVGIHHIIYLIKFEELIPRLQKYYLLENTRASLRDYEISADSKRVLNLMSLQFNRKMTPAVVIEIVRSISSYEWIGFKEKDAALNGIIKAYHCLRNLEQKQTPEWLAFEKTDWGALFLEAIEQVGYPSQLLHKAHKIKRSIRDLNLIMKICKDPRSNRFAEAWLYTCSADPRIYTSDELRQFLGFLSEVLQDAQLMRNKLVNNKILESFLNFAKIAKAEDLPSINALYLEIAQHMLKEQKNSAAFSMLLDGKAYLEQVTNAKIDIERIKNQMEDHLRFLSESKSDRNDSDSVLGRWRAIYDEKRDAG